MDLRTDPNIEAKRIILLPPGTEIQPRSPWSITLLAHTSSILRVIKFLVNDEGLNLKF
jgi:hypothetical protein